MKRLLALLLLFGVTQAQTLTVFAASSLTESFTALIAVFEAQHKSVKVRLNLAGSAVLAAQIEQGAPADVFASADLDTLLRVVDQEQVNAFATTQLVLITAKDSPIKSLEDLTKPHLLVLASANVPVGGYTREALAGLESRYGPGYTEAVLTNLVSEETNVRQAAAKVELGEADATFVYATDVAQLDNINVIDLPAGFQVEAVYYAAVVGEAQLELATEFISFVLSDEGQGILGRYGFGKVASSAATVQR